MEHKGLEGETYTRTQDLKGIWVLKGFVIAPFMAHTVQKIYLGKLVQNFELILCFFIFLLFIYIYIYLFIYLFIFTFFSSFFFFIGGGGVLFSS